MRCLQTREDKSVVCELNSLNTIDTTITGHWRSYKLLQALPNPFAFKNGNK